MARMGAETSSVRLISTRICTCCTSFVVRVMSDGAPNRDTSRSENAPTRSKTAARISRPSAMAAFAPKYTATMAAAICTSVMPSITTPSRRMTPASPTAMPSSMMSALSAGR
jgi:hypothetical protein